MKPEVNNLKMTEDSYEEALHQAALEEFMEVQKSPCNYSDDSNSIETDLELRKEALAQVKLRLEQYKTDCKNYEEKTAACQKEIHTTRKKLSSVKEERDLAISTKHIALEKVKETPEYLKLLEEKNYLTNKLVEFKMNFANLQAELEGAQDEVSGIQQQIKFRDNEIQNLSKQIERITREKDELLARYDPRKRASPNETPRFDKQFTPPIQKNEIRPFPSSSFNLMNLSFSASSTRRAANSLNTSTIDDNLGSRSNRSVNSTIMHES